VPSAEASRILVVKQASCLFSQDWQTGKMPVLR